MKICLLCLKPSRNLIIIVILGAAKLVFVMTVGIEIEAAVEIAHGSVILRRK
jgi:hypothetical protein